MGLTGQSFTANLGTAVAPNEDVTLTGQAITSAQGTAIGFGGSVVFPSGFSITSAQGTAIAPNECTNIIWSRSFVKCWVFSWNGFFCCKSNRCFYDRFCRKYITCRYYGINRYIIYIFCRIIDPKDQVMGLTGVSASLSVGAVNVLLMQILTRVVTRRIVMFQRVRILLIRMLQLAQIQAITT